MKYYVVTEEELKDYGIACGASAVSAHLGGINDPRTVRLERKRQKLEYLCLSRQVPEEATHFAGGWVSKVDPMEEGLSSYWEVERCEEIQK